MDQQNRQLNAKVGPGGAPTRATTLPEAAAERKEFPIASGLLDYFPDALAAIANISYRGNKQHHPDKPLHWDRSKSADEADTAMRHFLQRGTLDTDGARHTAKAAWRILALLQKEIENEQKELPPGFVVPCNDPNNITADEWNRAMSTYRNNHSRS